MERAWAVALDTQLPSMETRVRSTVGTFDLLPAVLGLASGPSGELWVKREPVLRGETSATLMSSTAMVRSWGPVRTPVDVDLWDADEDYLLGTMLDEFDVPYVVLLRLTRS